MTPPAGPCVVGVGSAWRRDDGVGLEVIRRMRGRVDASVELLACQGDLSALLLAWTHRPLVILVDAMRSGVAAGTIRRLAPLTAGGVAALATSSVATQSTHAVGLVQAIQLATELDLLPRRLICYAVEAGDLGHGGGLSPPVAAAVEPVIARIIDELMANGTRSPTLQSTDA